MTKKPESKAGKKATANEATENAGAATPATEGGSAPPAGGGGQQATFSGEMPPFFSKLEALDPERHAKLKYASKVDYAFAAQAHAIPVNGAELPLAARSMPIVFTGRDRIAPVAITGLRQGQNLFVRGDGSWLAPHYVPVYLQCYPFIFIRNRDSEQFVLCVDPDCSRVGESVDGNPLFVDGQPSEQCNAIMEVCGQFRARVEKTEDMMKAIEEADLLVERQGNVTLDSGETLQITDFRVIDEQKFLALDADANEKLRQAGAMPIIYGHLISQNSWANLVHMTQNAPLQTN